MAALPYNDEHDSNNSSLAFHVAPQHADVGRTSYHVANYESNIGSTRLKNYSDNPQNSADNNEQHVSTIATHQIAVGVPPPSITSAGSYSQRRSGTHGTRNTMQYVNFEEILSQVNPFGRFQIRFAILMQLCILGFCGNFVLMSFGMLEPRWHCQTAKYYSEGEDPLGQEQSALVHFGNGSSTNATGKCKIRDLCPAENLTFESDAGFFSVVEQWNLYCEHDYIPHMITTVQMAGLVVGYQVAGYLADHLGRRIVYLVSMSLLNFCGLISTLATGWPSFTICRFLIGFFVAASTQSIQVWAMEITDSAHNVLMSCTFLWQFAYMAVALIGHFSHSWRSFTIIINTATIPCIIGFAFCMESPRWLIQHKQYTKARKSLYQLALVNGKHEFAAKLTTDTLSNLKVAEKDRHYSFIHLFHSKTLTTYTLLLMGSMFTAGTIAASFLFNLKNLAGNPFMDLFIYGLARSWVPFFAYFMDKKFSWFGRRPMFLLTITLVMLCFLAVTICFGFKNGHSIVVVTFFAMLGAVLTNVLWVVLGVYVIELFPTVIRVIAAGFVSMGSELGSIVAPQLLYLDKVMPALPYIFLLVVCALNLVFGFFLFPETKGQALPEGLHSSPSVAAVVASLRSDSDDDYQPLVSELDVNAFSIEDHDSELDDDNYNDQTLSD